jgi:hypothetical protein
MGGIFRKITRSIFGCSVVAQHPTRYIKRKATTTIKKEFVVPSPSHFPNPKFRKTKKPAETNNSTTTTNIQTRNPHPIPSLSPFKWKT